MNTPETRPKVWRPGVADEEWKVAICKRDAERAQDTLNYLVYVLTDAGNDYANGIAQIENMSGKQIVSGMRAYIATSHRSIKNGTAEVTE